MPVSLRDQFDVNTDDGTAARIAEEARAADMWALNKGYTGARIGTDINSALAQEAGLRASGRTAEADAAALRAQELQKRQALYATGVDKVEDIHGLRDAGTWLAGMAGQGLGSMQDPAVAAAIGQGIGTVAGFVPRLKGVAKLAPMLGAAAGFGINQRQMTGEMYGRLKQDPVAMANMTPQEANVAANAYGLGAGALETVLPTLAGRAVGGAALKGGLRTFAPNAGARFAGDLAMEGGTELGQQMMQQYGHSLYNPNRNTSGDFSENLNAFAGGAAGAAPMAGIHTVAHGAFDGVHRTGEAVKGKAGQIADITGGVAGQMMDAAGNVIEPAMDTLRGKAGDVADIGSAAAGSMRERAGQMMDRAGEAINAAREAHKDLGTKGVIDLGMAKGKSVFDAVADKARQFGDSAYSKDIEQAKTNYDNYRLTPDQLQLLDDTPPADIPAEGIQKWAADNDAARREFIINKLTDLEQRGVPEATKMLDSLDLQDPVLQAQAFDSVAKYLKTRNDVANADQRAAQLQSFLADKIQKGTAKVMQAGSAAAKGASKGAAFVAENVAKGAAQGASKKNMQGMGLSTLDYETWKSWRDENAPRPTSEPGSTHAIQRAVQNRTGPAPIKTDPEAAARSRERATLFAEIAAAEATTTRNQTVHTANVGNYARSLAYEISDMADSWTGPQPKNRGVSTQQAGRQLEHLKLLANDIRSLYGENAPKVMEQMANAADSKVRPVVAQLQEMVAGPQDTTSLRMRLVSMLPQADQAKMLENGGEGARMLVDTMGQIARGLVPEKRVKEISKHLGQDVFGRMLNEFDQGDQASPGKTVDDTGTQSEFSTQHHITDDGEVDPNAPGGDFEARQAERKVQRNMAPRMYAFVGKGNESIRSSDEQRRNARDPFAADKSMSLAEYDAALSRSAEESQPIPAEFSRPRLVMKGETNARTGENLLNKKILDTEKLLGVDRTPENYFRLAKKEATGKQAEALARTEQQYKDGVPAAVAKINDIVKNFFETRAGDYVVSAKSALEVMNEMKMGPEKRLSIFRDYMLQEAAKEAAKNPENAAKYRALAKNAHTMLVRGDGGNPKITQADGIYGPHDVGRPNRSGAPLPAIRKTVNTAMNRYFSSRYLVTADQLSDRVAGSMTKGEFLDLTRRGDKAISAAKGEGVKSGNNSVAGSIAHETETNILHFPTNGKDVAIKADNLVSWVRNQRREEADTKGTPNEKYLRDLYEGIAAVTAMDQVTGMPWVKGIDGREMFNDSEGAVPNSLALPSGNGWSENKKRADRVKRVEESGSVELQPGSFLHQEVVARDVTKGEDWFQPDPYESVDAPEYIRIDEPVADGKPRRTTAYANRPTSVTVRRVKGLDEYVSSGRTITAPGAKGPGEYVGSGRTITAPGANLKRSDRMDVTPLDSKSFRADDSAIEDTRGRTGDIRYDIGPESRSDAVSKASDRAGSVWVYTGEQKETTDAAGELTRVDKTLDMPATIKNIEARLNAAEKKPHYAYPLAYVLSASNVEKLLTSGNIDPKYNAKITELQKRVAQKLMEAPSGARLRLARAMAGSDSNLQTYEQASAFMRGLAEPSSTRQAKIAERVIHIVTNDDFSSIKSDEAADAFIKGAKDTFADLTAREREAAKTGADLTPEETAARLKLRDWLKPGSTFDWASLYPTWKGDSSKFEGRISKALGTAAPEVAAQSPKSQSKVAGVKLSGDGPFVAKDQKKADLANKFIGRGSARSSTARYARDFGPLANTGVYSSQDTVFISAEGARSGRLSPDFAEIRRAMDAGATLVTDSPADRGRTYNYGERQVAEFLGKNGYRESSPGRWIRAQSAAATAASQRQAFAHEREQLLKKEQSPSRVDALAGRVTRMDLDPEGRAAFSARQRAASTMAGLFARGESMVKVLDHPSLADDMAQLIASQLNGSETAASAIRSLQYAADQFNALPVPSHVNQAVMSAATKNEATISSVLKPLRESPDASPISKALAAAVTKVAGGTKVRFDDELGGGTHGMWYGATRDIGLNQRLASTATIVHEATHAATVDAIMRSPELHRAVFNLMDHVLTEKPDLAEAYGMTNSLEFLAEGMSNVHFQQQLKAIKPSSAVAKYLGETAANAWNSFVQLVRNALGLSPEHDSALSQLLDLSGRAMKDTAMNGRAEYGTPLVERRVVPVKDYTNRVNRLVEALAERGAAEEDLGFVSDLLTGLSNGRDVPFGQALAVEVAIRSLPLMKNASVDEVMNNIMRTLIASGLEKDENGKTDALGPLRLPSRLSTQVHNDLRRPGFAATHDSPIRHGGEFNWREHTGKGEGNAAFGAGTYLSTDNTVHSFYKQQFTGMLVNDPRFKGLIGQKALKAVREAQKADGTVADAIDRAIDVLDAAAQKQGAEGILSRKAAEDLRKDRATYIKAAENVSPTYHVSVDIKPEQLLNWDKPLSEQSSYVKKRLEGELRWTNQKRWSGETSINLTIGTTAFGKPIWAPDDNPTGQYLVASDPLDRYGDTFGTLEEAKKFVAGKATAGSLSGEYIYKGLTQRLGSQAAASDYLQSLGILGHEYAAKDGRNGERPNYVIYDDSKISTNYVRFNAQTANGHVAPSQESIDQAHEYLGKVLGKQIETQFEEITDYNGEWIDHANVVKISTITGVGMLDVARHEALHAFWSKFAENNPKAVEVLKTLTDDPKVVRRLEYLLRDDPAALKQLQDGEERLAYIYQFAMAGALRLPHTPGTTLMAKVRKFLRRVFMMVSDQERAVDLLYAFEHGKMSDPSSAGKAVAAALDQGTWMRQGALKMDAVTQRLAGLVTPAHDLLLNSYSPTARKIGSMFYTSPGRESKDGATGYLNERNQRMRMFDNLFRRAIDGLDPAQMDALRDAMQRETPMEQMRDPDVVAARKELRALFERFHRYMTDEKGLRIGKIRTNYFPVVWDSQAIQADPSKFTGMLVAKYRPTLESMASEWNTAAAKRAARTGQKEPVEVFTAEKVAQSLATLLTRSEGVLERDWSLPQTEDGVLRPWMASGKERTLGFISAEDRAPFLEKNIVTTLSRYFRQGVRTAEYSSRFGRDGVMLRGMLEQAQDEIRDTAARMLKSGDLKDQKAADKWAARQFRNISNATGAMEGSLGAHVSNKVRSLNSAAVVYQNVRLLPLALFSSFVDPLGIIARGGEMRDALRTFADGMKGVTRQWGDMIREEHADRDKSQWEKLAEFAGVIDAATFSHLISDEYGSVYLDGRAKKINEVMFKANGMEAWNRAMRVGATQAAVKFIERHTTSPTEHSERWMENLGFTKDAPAPLDNEGHLITDKRVLMAHDPSLTQEQAEDQIQRVYSGLVRWVEGAVLSPNAAQRPAWGSDPHYSAFWHLKQFAYSFHQTFIRRAMTEAKYGNIMPLGVFAWYIPVMIASDIIKGLALGAGELPAYMKGYDLGDWVLQGVQRGGLLGPYQMGVDALKDPSSLGGPAVEQIFDFMKDPIEKSAVHALPMNALYSRAVL